MKEFFKFLLGLMLLFMAISAIAKATLGSVIVGVVLLLVVLLLIPQVTTAFFSKIRIEPTAKAKSAVFLTLFAIIFITALLNGDKVKGTSESQIAVQDEPSITAPKLSVSESLEYCKGTLIRKAKANPDTANFGTIEEDIDKCMASLGHTK